MKKGLSAILAASLTFSAFGSVAFAADELSVEQKWQQLVDAGIFDKDGTGDGANLDDPMTRAQYVKVLARLEGLSEATGTPSFDDVKDHWAAGYVEAAKKAGLVDGVSDNPPLFAPDQEVTLEQLAKLMVEALDLKVDAKATVSGEVSDWAKGYVAAAVKAGLLKKADDYTKPALREVLVEATYKAREIEAAKHVTKIESFKGVASNKLEVVFSKAVADTSKVTYKLKKDNTVITGTKATWSDDKKTLTIKLPSIIRKGEYTISVSGIESEALTSKVSLENEKVTKIEFVGDKAPLARDFDTDSSNDNKKAYAWVKVYNQYNEDVTKRIAGSLTISGSYQTSTPNSNGRIEITNTSSTFLLDSPVVLNAFHRDSGTYASATLKIAAHQLVASVEIEKLYHTFDKALKAEEQGSEYYLLINAKDQYGNTYGVKGEDLNALEADTHAASTNGYVIDVARTSDGKPDYGTVVLKDGTERLALKLAGPNGNGGKLRAGTSQIQIYSIKSGSKATFDVTVSDVQKVDTISFQAPDVIAGGDNNGVEVPFTALDAEGKEIPKTADNFDKFREVTVRVDGADIVAVWEQDHANNKVKLVLKHKDYLAGVNKLPSVSEGQTLPFFLSATTTTHKFANIQLTLRPNAKVDGISKIEPNAVAVAPNGTIEIKRDKIKVVDQYYREKSLDKWTGKGYSARVSVKSGDLSFTTGSTIDGSNGTVKLKAASDPSNPSASLEIKVTGGGKEFTKTQPIRIVKRTDIVDYEIADIGKLFTSDALGKGGKRRFTRGLDVKGVLADGTKVAIADADESFYKVSTSDGLGYTGNDASVTDAVYAPQSLANAWGGETKEKTTTITIIGQTATGAKQYQKQVVFTNAPRVADKFEYHDTQGLIEKVSDGVIKVAKANVNSTNLMAIAQDAIKVIDQYGIEIDSKNYSGDVEFKTVWASNLRNEKYELVGSGTDLTRAQVGYTFDLTAVTENGKSITIKVVVK